MAKTTVKNWKSADEALARMGELKRQITAITTAEEPQIQDLMKAMEEKTAPLQAECDTLEAELRAFALNHLDDFGGARSKEMLNGIVKLRKTTDIEYLEGEDKTLSLLQQLGYEHCYKVTSKISKTALKAMSADTLRQVAAAKVESTSASIELK